MLKKIKNGLSLISRIFGEELRNSLTDAGTVLLFIIAVIAYPVLYSIGYLNETLKEVPVAVVDLDHTPVSRTYARMIDATEQVHVAIKPVSLKEAEDLFYENKVNGIVLIPENFEKDIYGKKPARVSVYCDASKFLVYKQVFQGAVTATGYFSAGIEYRQLEAMGKMPAQATIQADPLQADIFNLFNPSSAYATFIVPGILLIVIQQSMLVGIGVLTGKMHEHRKKDPPVPGDYTSSHPALTVLGKSASYVFLYLFTSLFLLGVLYRWLNFPEKGSFLSVYLILIPFLFTIAFAGMAVSFIFRKRVNALMFLVFISPAVFFLSGISWPLQSMPWLVRAFSWAFPTTFALPAFIKLRIIGGGAGSVTHEWFLQICQMAVYFVLACFSIHYDQKKVRKMAAIAAIP
jgi:ABC-2 type transport system permease protein